jgi:hypothetical protein
MAYPFVVLLAVLTHWPRQAMFVTTRPVRNSTDKGRAQHPVRWEKIS